jgi:hypothetical protein
MWEALEPDYLIIKTSLTEGKGKKRLWIKWIKVGAFRSAHQDIVLLVHRAVLPAGL